MQGNHAFKILIIMIRLHITVTLWLKSTSMIFLLTKWLTFKTFNICNCTIWSFKNWIIPYKKQCPTYHYWHFMECTNFFTQIAVSFLSIFLGIKGNIPTVVMSKFTIDKLRTFLTREQILNLLFMLT